MLTCNIFFISCSPLTGFDDLIVACNLLCSIEVLFECRRTILWAMLCIVSWSQGLVMVKNPCEATITKSLAWLVEQLVVSSHEFSFTLFSKTNSKIFYHFFYRCFYHLFCSPLFSFSLLQASSSFLFYFSNHFSFIFTSLSSPSSHLSLLDFLFFSLFLILLQRRTC